MKTTKRKTTRKKKTVVKKPEYKMFFKSCGVSKEDAEMTLKGFAKPVHAKLVKQKNGKYNIRYRVYRFLPIDPKMRPPE